VVAVLKEAVSVRSEVSFTVRGFCVLPSLHLSKAKPVFGVARTVCVLPSSKVPPPETLPWLSLAERTVSVRFFGCVVPPGLEGLPGLEGSPSGLTGAEISTLVLPSLMALRTAAWADRVATRLNSASARRLRNSLPGSQQTVTRWMFCELNFSAVSAPLLLSATEKSPSSPRRIFLPSSSCSRMQSTAM